MLITIDGCTGAGKSTLANWLVQRHGYVGLTERLFCQLREEVTEDDNCIVAMMKAVLKYRKVFDLDPRTNYVIERFWEPILVGLFTYSEPRDMSLFHETVCGLNRFIRSYDACRGMQSFWLDAPYPVSQERAWRRDGKELLPIPKETRLNRWRRFAREMSTDLDCFRVIDATLPVRDVQRQIADILDIE